MKDAHCKPATRVRTNGDSRGSGGEEGKLDFETAHQVVELL